IPGPGHANRSIPVWDVGTGELVATLGGHERQVSAVEFAPDGRRIVSGSFDGTLRTWDADTWEQERVLEDADAHDYGFYGLGFSPDGRWLLAGPGLEPTITVFDAETLERHGEFTGHTDYIQDVTFLGDDRVVSSGGDRTARVWDVETFEEILVLSGHTGAVLNVAVSPDGSRIATAGYDAIAKLWDAQTGDELMTMFGHDKPVHTVAFSPDGRFIATASPDGTVALRLLRIAELREVARERATRGLTPEECERYLHLPRCPPG
ncbi:MAG TPA: WD40 repeat domain-containing protein, partial [Actinomycetota bacterium]|nr:WD40 repeat domain-containing protein [Actinomycetota bacterium]